MLRRESDTHSLFTSGETSDNDCEVRLYIFFFNIYIIIIAQNLFLGYLDFDVTLHRKEAMQPAETPNKPSYRLNQLKMSFIKLR